MGTFLRLWHKWIGMLCVLALTSFALTGIYLNRRDAFDRLLFAAPAQGGEKAAAPSPLSYKLTTASQLRDLPLSPEQALAIARREMGEVELARLELKSEKGGLVYKVKPKDSARGEIILDAATGKLLEKKPGKHPTAEFLAKLHHFNFADGRTKILADLFAGGLILLNLSGVWMFLRHELALRRSRRLAQQRAAARSTTRPTPELSPTE